MLGRSGFHHLLPLRNLKFLCLKSLLNKNKTKRKTKRTPQKKNHTFLWCCAPVLGSPNHFFLLQNFYHTSPITCNHVFFTFCFFNFFVSITSFDHFSQSPFAFFFQLFLQSFSSITFLRSFAAIIFQSFSITFSNHFFNHFL